MVERELEMELFRRCKTNLALLALGLTGALLLLYYTRHHKPHNPQPRHTIPHNKPVEPDRSWEHVLQINELGSKQQNLMDEQKSFEKQEILVVQDHPQETVNAPVPPVTTQSNLYVHSSMKLGPALKTHHTSNQTAIVEAIRHAWSAYRKYAWGADEVKPVSMKSFAPSYGLGMTLIDCLDTLWLAGLQEEFDEARKWVANSLDIEGNRRTVSLFETNIRVLGGLLGAYHLSLDKLFLDKAVELAKHLLPAFDTTSGVPAPVVNLEFGISRLLKEGSIRKLSVAEAGTVQLEFRDVSRASGDPSFQAACDKDMNVLLEQGQGSMMPMMVYPSSGRLVQSTGFSVGAGIDSYYEYLLKQWLQSGKTESKFVNAYTSSVKDIASHLVAHSGPSKLAFIGKASTRSSVPSSRMDHLSCFYPGMLALGLMNGLHSEQRSLASDLTYTCYTAYSKSPSGLAPEIFHFNWKEEEGGDDFVTRGVHSIDFSNILRPETVESLFYEYRLTKDPRYRDWGWQIFQAFEKHTKIKTGGYSGVWSVLNTNRKQDKMESFFITETLKYLFLLFSDDPDILRLDEWVFNTEAHPLPIWKVTDNSA